MKELAPIIGAGGSFAGCAVVGLLLGIAVAGRTGSQGWVFGGLALGIVVGGYSAFRLLRRSIG